MTTTPRHLEFAPPPTPGILRALVLAILAHGVLLTVLSAGVQWKRDAVQETFEAELWAKVPTQAAAPAPEPVVEPEPAKPVPPKPEPKPEPAPAPPDTTKADAEIALQKEKAKAKQLKEKKLALEKAELEKKKLAELEKQKQAKLEQDKKDKLDKQKKEQTDKLAKAKDELQRKQDAKEAQQAQAQRDAAVKRAMGLAGTGGNGAPGSTGTAAQSSGPSASYLGRLAARVKPNIVFSESMSGNPAVEVDVTTSPSGKILSARVTKSSGVKAWDEAVLRAIEKTEVLPRDTDGMIPSLIPFSFRPKD
jgi:colicin import membrane protein